MAILKMSDAKMRKKVNELKELAVGSVFFPFTEPKVKSPLTGKYVGGEKKQTDKVQHIINKCLK